MKIQLQENFCQEKEQVEYSNSKQQNSIQKEKTNYPSHPKRPCVQSVLLKQKLNQNQYNENNKNLIQKEQFIKQKENTFSYAKIDQQNPISSQFQYNQLDILNEEESKKLLESPFQQQFYTYQYAKVNQQIMDQSQRYKSEAGQYQQYYQDQKQIEQQYQSQQIFIRSQNKQNTNNMNQEYQYNYVEELEIKQEAVDINSSSFLQENNNTVYSQSYEDFLCLDDWNNQVCQEEDQFSRQQQKQHNYQNNNYNTKECIYGDFQQINTIIEHDSQIENKFNLKKNPDHQDQNICQEQDQLQQSQTQNLDSYINNQKPESLEISQIQDQQPNSNQKFINNEINRQLQKQNCQIIAEKNEIEEETDSKCDSFESFSSSSSYNNNNQSSSLYQPIQNQQKNKVKNLQAKTKIKINRNQSESTSINSYSLSESQNASANLMKKIKFQKQTETDEITEYKYGINIVDSKITTAHVPTNIMNLLIPYLLTFFENETIYCQRGFGSQKKCKTDISLCACQNCTDYIKLKKLKSGKKNKNLKHFRQIWNNMYLRVLSEHYFINLCAGELLSKKIQKNTNLKHRYSALLLIYKFIEGVRNPQKFVKLL